MNYWTPQFSYLPLCPRWLVACVWRECFIGACVCWRLNTALSNWSVHVEEFVLLPWSLCVCDSHLNQLMIWLFISVTNCLPIIVMCSCLCVSAFSIGCSLICLSWASIVSGNRISPSHGWLQLFTAFLMGMNGRACCEGWTLCLTT